MRQLLSKKVIPKEVRTDNGPHFNGQVLQEFARELAIGFEHITSSSHYPRSNGFIESQVKSVRSAVMKSKTTKSDPNISLPCPRSTFVDHKLPLSCRVTIGASNPRQPPKEDFKGSIRWGSQLQAYRKAATPEILLRQICKTTPRTNASIEDNHSRSSIVEMETG